MVSKFLVSHFIKDYNNTTDEKIRERYGYLGGIVGILINSLLFLIKLFTGITTKSISIIADGFNNLSDLISSIITMVGFKLAGKPADEEHPFGHGRVEYLSALIVSVIVILVGLQFIKVSFNRIVNPKPVIFNMVAFILILISIFAKIWLSQFNKYLGKSINSNALVASSLDARGDVFTSFCVAISLILSKWTSFPIDGYIGILISLFIVYSGFSLIKDTLNPLLGEPPDPQLVEKIKKGVLKYEYISGVHDLIIHNYGPGKCMASIHAEIPQDISVVTIHEVIDKAERELSSELNIYLVIHMDPIDTDCKFTKTVKMEVENIISEIPEVKSMHDFRITGEGENRIVIFDLIIEGKGNFKQDDEKILKEKINFEIQKLHPNYTTVITLDKSFTVL
ncbi:cation diffusion facilitator family transporter [Sporanaerobacter sp. PP17-6a]|uniref:cation diffusion facilitator family transporter n=1 Tax=Sporanaerobacter sp. PP17-6a TaxID=1891289 RepID=UPI00089FD161|nr:cation diffusion facilitator family transporter [Sporanaerobacter sp. PP17-6a]SCL90568.1 Ferrous-iron efflux pump FieF [Sporanaerobacter sp. PP17-6a]